MDVICRAVAHLVHVVRHASIGRKIAKSYRRQPQSKDNDELAMANALAMSEAEPW